MQEEDALERASKHGGQSKMSRPKDTSIEREFRLELLIIKLCGGFMFDINKYLRLFYRISIIILVRYLSTQRYITTMALVTKPMSKASKQNINLFWYALNVCWVLVHLGTIHSGVKYHNLFMVILRKKFDARYLPDESSDGPNGGESRARPVRRCATCRPLSVPHQSLSGSASSFGSLLSQASSTSPDPSDLSKQSLISHPTTGSKARLKSTRHKTNDDQLEHSPESSLVDQLNLLWHHVARTQMMRMILIGYLLFSVTVSLVNVEIIPHLIRKPSDPVPQRLSNWLIWSHNSDETTHKTVFNATTQGALATVTPPKQGPARWMSFFEDPRERSLFTLRLILGMARTVSSVVFCLLFVIFNYSQVYGHALVTWMITSTLTDMLHKCSAQTRGQHIESFVTAPRCGRCHGLIGADKLQHSWAALKKTEPAIAQNTKLLIQVHDVLIALRCAMSLEYLVLLILDLCRLMCAFSVFSAYIGTDQFGMLVQLFAEYFRVVMAILLTRIGYHNLHAQVHKIREASQRQMIATVVGRASHAVSPTRTLERSRKVSARTYRAADALLSDASNNSLGSLASLPNVDSQQRLSRAELERLRSNTRMEATLAYRLACEIENLWPTDWFKPDLRSYVSQNVLVITFVATLQQLVEASAKVEFRSLNASALTSKGPHLVDEKPN